MHNIIKFYYLKHNPGQVQIRHKDRHSQLRQQNFSDRGYGDDTDSPKILARRGLFTNTLDTLRQNNKLLIIFFK